jgi:hypothetical protein
LECLRDAEAMNILRGAPENEQMDEDANGKTWNESTDTIMAE